MAKGIPIIGRAPDKRAKIVNVDEMGNLKVSQLESKLDGIENKLVALEQKLTDGSQKVQLSGNIKSTKVYRSPGSAIPAGVTETLLEITGEVIVHDVIFYFREGVGDPCMRVSFFNGLSWNEYNRFNVNYGEWDTKIQPSNVLVDPLFKLLVENKNVVTLRTPGLRIKGIRIDRRNLSAQEDGNVGVNVIYSEV